MAEFKDVIKQQKRMCDAMENCGQCPLIDADCACRFSCMIEGDFDLAETEMIERIVMDWAKKHPEPRYPTWSEWQISNFQMAERAICAAHFMDAGDAGCCTSGNNCDKCRERPIPADIAEKLGIKPMGGGEDA